MKLLPLRTFMFGSLVLLAACSSGVRAPEPELTPTASGSVQVPVRSGADDAEELSSGDMLANGRFLDFSLGGQLVGLRFTGVSIPPGATITKAYVRLIPSDSKAGSTTLNVRAHDADSAAAFTDTSRDLSSRSLTSAAATWNPPSWSRGVAAQSSDLSGIVQEVVSRSGWRSGNALALVVSGDDRAVRSAIPFEQGGTQSAPTLYVTYETSGDDGDDGDDGGSSGGDDGGGGDVGGNLSTWNARLVATITNPKYDRYNAWMEPERQVARGDLFSLGRNFNNYASNLILAYRESGDRRLVQQLDRLMNIAKGKLEDTNGDGYLNWLYLQQNPDSTSAPYVGTDEHIMDEILAHSMVAGVAYTFKQAGFNSSAAYWTNYLKNHFEAKWRERNNKPTGYPFTQKDLMHPYAQFIRYHFYMARLTGDSSYYTEAKRMAGVVKRHMRSISTPNGTGYTWDHRINDLHNRSALGCQPTVYIRYTMQAFAELATLDSSLFDRTFMTRVANTMAHTVLKKTDGSYMTNNICGGGGQYGDLYYFVSYPYSTMAPWDASGRIERATRTAYANTEEGRYDSPRIYNLPAGMVFILGN